LVRGRQDECLLQRCGPSCAGWEGDEPGMTKSVTLEEFQRKACRITNALHSKGVRKGDVVM